MTFTYTYRDGAGAKREAAVEAANRAAAVAALKAQGVSPLEIGTGKVRIENGKAADGRSRFPAVPWILILIAILGGGAMWFLRRGESLPPLRAKTPERTAPLQSVGSGKRSSEHKAKQAETATNAPVRGVAVKSSGESYETRPATVPQKPSWPPPPVQRDANGRVIPPPGAITLDSQKSIFERSSDTYIAMLISPRTGESLPPMPLPGPTMEEEFLASLKEPIEISPDDSPDDRAMKLAVAATRDEIKRLLDTGVRFTDIVREHETLLKENNEIREKALTEYREILKTGNEKAADRYLKTVNGVLQKMGVPPMEKPKSRDEIRARMLESRARNRQQKGRQE